MEGVVDIADEENSQVVAAGENVAYEVGAFEVAADEFKQIVVADEVANGVAADDYIYEAAADAVVVIDGDFVDVADNASIYYQNSGGLRTKTIEFYNAVTDNSYAVIALTETWLCDSISNTELFDASYVVYRKDRCSITTGLSRGGGVLLAIKSSFRSSWVDLDDSSGLIEQICVCVDYSRSRDGGTVKIYYILSYIPPYSDISIYLAHISNIKIIADSLDLNSFILVLGDFNLSNVKWIYSNDDKCLIPCNALTDFEVETIDSMLTMSFVQFNGIRNSIGRILDLVYTYEDLILTVTEATFLLSNNSIHHKALLISFDISFLNCYSEDSNQYDCIYDFLKADYNYINYYLSLIDWELSLSGSSDLNDMFALFMNIIEDVFSKCVPLKRVVSSNKPVWFNKRLANLKGEMKRMYKKSLNDSSHHVTFCRLRKEYEFLKRFLYRQHILSVESKIKRNPKAFWTFLNTKRKSLGIPLSMKYNDVLSSDLKNICNMFANFFQSNYVAEPESAFEPIRDVSSVNLGNLYVSKNDILSELSSLDGSPTLPPDNIPAIFVKNCRYNLVIPFHIIFNLSLSTGVFLDCWKYSFVTPIHKSGSKQNIENYRPIAKLQLVPKVFEAIVKRKLYSVTRSLISEDQHGFVSGRSTVTNLAIFTNFCLHSMERRFQVDAIYTDFAKAFDRVQFHILERKLLGLGFHATLLSWVMSYLKNRKQYVKLGSHFSKTIFNHSGVPQGSHLGPLLFLLFINDLPNFILNSSGLLFADDFKIFRQIKTVSDCTQLQLDIDRLTNWCDINCLYLNIRKCSVMSFTRARNPILFAYNISKSDLNRVTVQKDLGVIFNSQLSFALHMDFLISKSNAMLGFIFRNSKEFSDPYTLKTLFVSLVRSNLEYCCTIWSPYYNKGSLRLERIQKRFTKFALRRTYLHSDMPSYNIRCQLIQLKPLQNRRDYYFAMFARDILCNHIDSPKLLSLFNIYAPARFLRPRENDFFYIPRHNTNYGLNNPICNAASCFNQFEDLLDFHLSRNECKTLLVNNI